MRDQKSQRGVNLRVVDHVIVVEDETKLQGEGRDGLISAVKMACAEWVSGE